jgi:hypothetical protein
MTDETRELLKIFGVALTDLEAGAEKLAATAAQISPAAVVARLRCCCRMPRSSSVGIQGSCLTIVSRQVVASSCSSHRDVNDRGESASGPAKTNWVLA